MRDSLPIICSGQKPRTDGPSFPTVLCPGDSAVPPIRLGTGGRRSQDTSQLALIRMFPKMQGDPSAARNESLPRKVILRTNGNFDSVADRQVHRSIAILRIAHI